MKNSLKLFVSLSVITNLLLLISLTHLPFLSIEGYSNIPQNENVIGIVTNGTFIVAETKEPKNLTSIAMQEAVSSESGWINLTQYEGKAIFVTTYPGVGEGGWLYSANITDVGSPITNKLVKKVYNFE